MRQLSDKYSSSGLEILAFPCNQFLSQEPKSAAEVESCSLLPHSTNRAPQKGKRFRYFEKIKVNGPYTHPVYRFLRRKTSMQPLGWNFCMFLIDRSGCRVIRYGATVHPSSITQDLEELLAASPTGTASEVEVN